MKNIVQALVAVALFVVFSQEASAITPVQYKITNTEKIDNQITIESGEVENVPLKITTYKKNGDYILKYIDTKKPLPSTEENVKSFAKNMNAVVAINAGFWNYDDAEKAGSWSKRELDMGKKGVLYSDGDNNFRAGVYGVTSKRDIFSFVGEDGWTVGAFGAIVEDGIVQTRWEEGDPNVKTARNMLVEFKDGTIKLIQNYGHSSTNNGLNHNEMVDFLRSFGLENIKMAFNLDGGGSTRMYVKGGNGDEIVTGAFVDGRTNSAYLGLVKRPTTIDSKVVVGRVNESVSLQSQDAKIKAPNTGFSKNLNGWIFAIVGGIFALILLVGLKNRKTSVKF